MSALTKLDRVLPAQLREQVAALRSVTVGLGRADLPAFDVDALVTTALACSRPERLRFTYTDANDTVTDRLAEPYRLVFTQRSWYLVAFDTTRRLAHVPGRPHDRDQAHRCAVRAPRRARRGGDGRRRHGGVRALLQARILLHLPIEEARRAVSRTIGVLEPGPDPATTIARIGGDADWIARYLVGLECRFEVLEPDEVRTEVRELAKPRIIRCDHQLSRRAFSPIPGFTRANEVAADSRGERATRRSSSS